MAHVVFFDGVCNLCNHSVDFIIERDSRKNFRFASLQSEVAKVTLVDEPGGSQDMRSIVLFKNGRIYYRSNAVLEIARGLEQPWPAIYVFKLVPRFIRDILYNFISIRRYRWFGKRETCRIPSDEERSRFLEKESELDLV